MRSIGRRPRIGRFESINKTGSSESVREEAHLRICHRNSARFPVLDSDISGVPAPLVTNETGCLLKSRSSAPQSRRKDSSRARRAGTRQPASLRLVTNMKSPSSQTLLSRPSRIRSAAFLLALVLSLGARAPLAAGTFTWDGNANDNEWQSNGNWSGLGGAGPAPAHLP